MLLTTPQLLILSLPAVIVFPFLFHPAVWCQHSRQDRENILALSSTYAGALLIGMVFGLDNVRYGYPVLPMLAPLVGAVARVWRRGQFSVQQQRQLIQIITITLLGILVAQFTLATLIAVPATALAAIVSFAVLAAAALVYRRQGRCPRRVTLVGIATVLCSFSVSFAAFDNEQKQRVSVRAAALHLVQIVGESPHIVAGTIILQNRTSSCTAALSSNQWLGACTTRAF